MKKKNMVLAVDTSASVAAALVGLVVAGPPGAVVAPVPPHLSHLIGHKNAHPGAGLGPAPRVAQVLPEKRD